MVQAINIREDDFDIGPLRFKNDDHLRISVPTLNEMSGREMTGMENSLRSVSQTSERLLA